MMFQSAGMIMVTEDGVLQDVGSICLEMEIVILNVIMLTVMVIITIVQLAVPDVSDLW